MTINRQETRAVIDDTLARIRAIPDITVVNSHTDESESTAALAVAYVEFKFLPKSSERKAIKRQVEHIKIEVKRKPYVESVIILWNTYVQIT